jgi:hypothetical protein
LIREERSWRSISYTAGRTDAIEIGLAVLFGDCNSGQFSKVYGRQKSTFGLPHPNVLQRQNA